MNRILGKLTYANVIATVAVFIALGGASYAAIELPKNSVGPRQLKKSAVTPAKLSAAAKSTLTGPAGPQGATGPQGPQGKDGAKGANGATVVAVRSTEVTTNSGSNGSATANCLPGEVAVGGGVDMADGNIKNVWYFEPGGVPTPSTPGSAPTGWHSSWFNESVAKNTFRVYVVCASP